MIHWFSIRRVFALFALYSLLALSAYPLAAQDTATDEPDATAEETPEPIEVTFGPGDFNLVSATAGLSDLTSYRATLTLSFEGRNAGQPEQWSHTYVMLTSKMPAARQVTIDSEGDPATQVFMLETNGVLYERRGENGCTASAIQPDSTLAEIWEPAGFLSSVIGADDAGTETVNGVAANHYTFDERAHGVSGIAESTGEMWIASDGGYLVRYVLETTGGADYFGEDTEGTITWNYELADVNQPLVVDVPADCPAGMVDIPLLPDATDVLQMPSLTSFNTLTSLEDAAAFYEEQLSTSGGELTTPLEISDTSALLEFTQGDQLTSVIVIAGEESNIVYITIGSTAPTAASEGGEAPAPITVQVGEGSVDIPIMPDATDVANMPGIITYFTPTSREAVAAFYEEQFLAVGAQIYTPLALFGNIATVEYTLNDALIGINITAGEVDTSVFIRVDPMFSSPIMQFPLPDATLSAAQPETTSGECEGGIPMLPDAANVQNMFGVISYTTNTSVADAVAFYEEQVAALGGQVSSPMPASNMMAMLDVRQGDQALLVTITAAGGVNSVTITSASGSPLPPPSDCAASEPDASQSETASETSDAACMVSSGANANQRSGPGTNFDLAGTLAGGVEATVDGQATGSDSFVWWRLGEGVWVRSDVVNETGDCEGVPVVQP